MKNVLKSALVLFAASSMLVACDGNGTKTATDSLTKDSSTSVQSTTDTNYTVKEGQVDTTAMGDSTQATVDTVGKTVTTKTVVKKSVTKKQ
jgi:hypothetical protein